jgi:SprT-like family
MAKRQYKSKLQKVLDETEYTFETTFEDCVKWFRILNNEIFYKELPTLDEIDIRWRRSAHGWYTGIYDTEDPTYRYTILHMNKRYQSKKLFVSVLGHEMVHHWQFVNGEQPHHGASFIEWTDTFNKKGLKLLRAY